MKMLKISAVLMGLALFGFSGCGSSDSTTEVDGGAGTDAMVSAPDAGEYGLVNGPRCYAVTSILPGYSDGCGLGVETLVGTSLPGSYDATTGIFTLGTEGSLGRGLVLHNTGTLLRSNNPSDPTAPTCTWAQTDTTTLTMTSTYAFTASVVETEKGFAAACVPAGVDCTSTWAWTFVDDAGAKSPTTGCK